MNERLYASIAGDEPENVLEEANENIITENLIPKKNKKEKPKAFSQDEIYAIFTNNPKLNPLFEKNKINTSKYRWFNFFARILMEQFSRLANVYFLIIAVLQSVKEFSYSGGSPIILLPLSFVVILNGLKDFYEDFKRKKSDKKENDSPCYIYNNKKNEYELKKWRDIKLGDIIKVENNHQFPCDLIMLKSSDKNGICYVETKNIDGETNLKFQQTNENFQKNYNEKNDYVFITKPPNEFIYKFDATVYETEKNGNIKNINKFLLIDKKSFLLRGCTLRQTDFIIGVAIYIGEHTKSMINSPNLKNKHSSVEVKMNRHVVLILSIQIFISSIMSIIHLFFYILNHDQYKSFIYPDQNEKDNFLSLFLRCTGTWIIICTNFVPISLLVTMETIKFFQAAFMEWDIDFYDKESMNGLKVHSSTLNEELGQIRYLFTDKTGTLTKNYMKFKMMSIGNKIYGKEESNNLLLLKDKYGLILNVDFNDENNNFKNDLNNENNNLINNFMLCLSLCNSVIIDTKKYEKSGEIEYQSSSPDEQALVYFARSKGYILNEKSINNVITIEINGENKKFELLNNLEYSSERKRMSVICKNEDGKIILYAKGADSMIEKLLNKYSEHNKEILEHTNNYLSEFAKKGYRTLMIAYKEISEEDYKVWNEELGEVMKNPAHTEEEVFNLYDQIETNLTILGSTAIEDALQDEVDSTINSLLSTGMKIWMLTGDKLETAKNIAISCKLFNSSMKIYEISNDISIQESLIHILREEDFYNNDIIKGLLISSENLETIFSDINLLYSFYGICINCLSVVCCRVSPKQKAQLVNLIKVTDKSITMAVGDGANDVGMITEANVGIGIEGKEGTQAARAGDYSIKEFSNLKKLLFFHGRECYRRNSWIIFYNFYKNILMVFPSILSGFVSMFSGGTIYDPVIHQLYNMLYSSIPCFWFGVFNYEYSKKELINNSKYYIQGIYGTLYHTKRFFFFFISGVIEAFFIFLFPNIFLCDGNSDGTLNDFYSVGTVIYANAVIVANLKIILDTSTYDFINISTSILGILLYFITVFVTSSNYILSDEAVLVFYVLDNFMEIIFSVKFLFCILLTCVFCFFIEISVQKVPILYGILIEGKYLPPYKEIRTDDNFYKNLANYQDDDLISMYSKASSMRNSLRDSMKVDI